MQIAPPPDSAFLQPLTSRIVEGRLITPYDYRVVAIPLYTALTSTTTRGSATYNIPSNMKFRVRQITPHVVLRNPASEAESWNPASEAISLGGDARDRIYTKAMNCRISLAFQSRAFEVMPQMAFPLSDLMAGYGANPSFLDMPGLLLQGTTIDLTASLNDPTAAFSDTEYGIVLVGAFIRVD